VKSLEAFLFKAFSGKASSVQEQGYEIEFIDVHLKASEKLKLLLYFSLSKQPLQNLGLLRVLLDSKQH